MRILRNMTKQSKHKNEKPESVKEAADVAAQAGAAETDIKAQETATEEAAEAAEDFSKKYDELNDKYLRLYSEFDNYRKRVIKEKQDLSKYASEEVISGLLPVLDDFDRAFSLMDERDGNPDKEGFMLIFNKLKGVLSQKGLAEIEAMSQDFDTDFHEAIAKINASSEEFKNKVIDVTQKGYTLNGKVIRFAKVVVGI